MGKDISVSELRKMYSAVILAYGAEGHRTLGIPGEDLKGIVQARSFVNWYNGHPDFAHLGSTFHLDKVKDVVIIGQGNVALDCARILAKPWQALASTDITSEAMRHLQCSAVENIYIVGRRGYVQAACTIKELRELTQIPGVDVIISPDDIRRGSNASSLQEVEERRPLRRFTQLMRDIADGKVVNKSESHCLDGTDTCVGEGSEKRKKIYFKFLLSPEKFHSTLENSESSNDGDSNSSDKSVRRVEFVGGSLVGAPHYQSVVRDGPPEVLNCDLVLTSVGYKSHPLEDDCNGLSAVPFDYKRHTIPHLNGRVVQSSPIGTDKDSTGSIESGVDHDPYVQTGLYVAGWLKRGPTGIIGTNIPDAKETVQSLCDDAANDKLSCSWPSDPAERLMECKAEGREVTGHKTTPGRIIGRC